MPELVGCQSGVFQMWRTLTSAKIQIFLNRTNIGGTSEEVGGWYGLTD